MTLSDLDLENRLRDQRARAAETAPAPSDLAQRVRARAGEQRRNRMALAAAGIAAALVFVGLPPLASGLLTDGSRGESAAPSARPRTPAPSHLDLPPRGSLAGDDEWVAGVRALSWLPGDVASYSPEAARTLANPALEDRKVVYAGDVPGGRVALVMARAERELLQAWYAGPEQARPEQMRLVTGPGIAPRTQPLGLLTEPDPASDHVVLVVVARPGDEAGILTGREVTAAGEVRELVEPLTLEDGIGALALPGRPTFPPTVEVRIEREGQREPLFTGLQYGDELVTRMDDPIVDAEDRIEVADPRGLLDAVDGTELQWTARLLVAQYGVPVESLRPTLLAGGPAGPGSGTSALLVGITFPSGATTVSLSTQSSIDGQARTGTTTIVDPAPAGTPLLDRLIAVATSNVVVVSGPSTAVAAQLYGEDGALLTTMPLVDGAGVGVIPSSAPNPAPRLSTVRVLDGQGGVVAESTVEQER